MARANDERVMNTTVIMYNMIVDICRNSSVDNGISLSREFLEQITDIKKFNYTHIYGNKRFNPFMHYSELVINEIFSVLFECYDDRRTFAVLEDQLRYSPMLLHYFLQWLIKYCETVIIPKSLINNNSAYQNEKVYGKLDSKEIYIQAIIDFISGMTDHFAISVFNELITYQSPINQM